MCWAKPHSLGIFSIYQPDPPVDEFFLGGHVAQRRAMYVLAGPLFITGLPMLGRVLQGMVMHSQLLLQLWPPHDDEGYIISAGSFPHILRRIPSPLQAYSGTRVLSPEPIIRDPPVRCFTYGVKICRQRRHMDPLLRESVLYTRRRCSGGELLERTNRLRKVKLTDEQLT